MNDVSNYENVISEIQNILPTYKTVIDHLRSLAHDTAHLYGLYNTLLKPEKLSLNRLKDHLKYIRGIVSQCVQQHIWNALNNRSNNITMRRMNEMNNRDRCYSPAPPATFLRKYHQQLPQSQINRDDGNNGLWNNEPPTTPWNSSLTQRTPIGAGADVAGGAGGAAAAPPFFFDSNQIKLLKFPPLDQNDLDNLNSDTENSIRLPAQPAETELSNFELVRKKLQKIAANSGEALQNSTSTPSSLPLTTPRCSTPVGAISSTLPSLPLTTPRCSTPVGAFSSTLPSLPLTTPRCSTPVGSFSVDYPSTFTGYQPSPAQYPGIVHNSYDHPRTPAAMPMPEERIALKYNPHRRVEKPATATTPFPFSVPNKHLQRPMDPRIQPQLRNTVYTASESTDRNSNAVHPVATASSRFQQQAGDRHNPSNSYCQTNSAAGRLPRQNHNAVNSRGNGRGSYQPHNKKFGSQRENPFGGGHHKRDSAADRRKEFPDKRRTPAKERDSKSHKEDASHETKETPKKPSDAPTTSKPPIESNLDKLYRSANFVPTENFPKTHTNFKIPKKSSAVKQTDQQHQQQSDRDAKNRSTVPTDDPPKSISKEKVMPPTSVLETKKNTEDDDSTTKKMPATEPVQSEVSRRKTRSLVTTVVAKEPKTRKRASTPDPQKKPMRDRRQSMFVEGSSPIVKVAHNDSNDGVNKNLANIFQKTDDNCQLSTHNIINSVRRTRSTKNFNEVKMMNELFKPNLEDSSSSVSLDKSSASSRKASPVSQNVVRRGRPKTILRTAKDVDTGTPAKQRPSGRNASATRKSNSDEGSSNTSTLTTDADDKQLPSSRNSSATRKSNSDEGSSNTSTLTTDADDKQRPSSRNSSATRKSNPDEGSSNTSTLTTDADDEKSSTTKNSASKDADVQTPSVSENMTSQPKIATKDADVQTPSVSENITSQPKIATKDADVQTPSVSENMTSQPSALSKQIEELLSSIEAGENTEEWNQTVIQILHDITFSDDSLKAVKGVLRIGDKTKTDNSKQPSGDAINATEPSNNVTDSIDRLETSNPSGSSETLTDHNDEKDENSVEVKSTVEGNVETANETSNPSTAGTPPSDGRPSKKRRKNELDRLNEDINEMFIKDDVLSASGKRGCTLNANARASAKGRRSVPDEIPSNPRVAELRRLEEPVRLSSRLRAAGASPPLHDGSMDRQDENEEEPVRSSSRLKAAAASPLPQEKLSKRHSQTPTLSMNSNSMDGQDENEDEPVRSSSRLKAAAASRHSHTPTLSMNSNSMDGQDENEDEPVRSSSRLKAAAASRHSHTPTLSINSNSMDGQDENEEEPVRSSSRLRSAAATPLRHEKLNNQVDRNGAITEPPVIELDSNAGEMESITGILNNNIDWHCRSEYVNKCGVCIKDFSNFDAIAHYSSVHGENYVSRLPPADTNKIKNIALRPILGYHSGRHIIWVCKCPFCLELLRTTVYGLLEHFSDHTGENVFVCTFCNAAFKTHRLINRHIPKKCSSGQVLPLGFSRTGVTEFEIKVAVCHICNYMQFDRTQFIKHYGQHHDGECDQGYGQILFSTADDLIVEKKVADKRFNEILASSVLAENIEDDSKSEETVDGIVRSTSAGMIDQTDKDALADIETSTQKEANTMPPAAEDEEPEKKKRRIEKDDTPVDDVPARQNHTIAADKSSGSDTSKAANSLETPIGLDRMYVRPSVIQIQSKDAIISLSPMHVNEPATHVLDTFEESSALVKDSTLDSASASQTGVETLSITKTTAKECSAHDEVFVSPLSEEAEMIVPHDVTPSETVLRISMVEREQLKTIEGNFTEPETLEVNNDVIAIDAATATTATTEIETIVIEDDDEDWEDIEIIEPPANAMAKRNNFAGPLKSVKHKNRSIHNKFNSLLKANKTLNASQQRKKKVVTSVLSSSRERDHHSNSNSCESTTTSRSGSDRVDHGSSNQFPKAMITILNDLMSDSTCNDPIDLVPELAPMEPLPELNDISSILNSNLSSTTQQTHAATTFTGEPQGDSNEQQAIMQEAFDFVQDEQLHQQQQQQQQYVNAEAAASVITIPSPSSAIYRVHNVGYSKSSDDNLKFYCICKPCTFLFSSEAIGLETHFKSDHPLIKWNGFCGTCNEQVQSCPGGEPLPIAAEIKHMLEFHAQPGAQVTRQEQATAYTANIRGPYTAADMETVPTALADRPRIQVRCLPGDCLSRATMQRNSESPKVDERVEDKTLSDLLNAQQRPITKQPHPVFSITEPLLFPQNLIANAIETDHPIYRNVSNEFAITSVTSAGPLQLSAPTIPDPLEPEIMPIETSNRNALTADPSAAYQATPSFTTPLPAMPVPPLQLLQPQAPSVSTEPYECPQSALQMNRYFSFVPSAAMGAPSNANAIQQMNQSHRSFSPIAPVTQTPPLPRNQQLAIPQRQTDSPGPLVVAETVPLSTLQTGDFRITQTFNADYRNNDRRDEHFGFNIEIVAQKELNPNPDSGNSSPASKNTNNVQTPVSVGSVQQNKMTSTDEITQKIRSILDRPTKGSDATTTKSPIPTQSTITTMPTTADTQQPPIVPPVLLNTLTMPSNGVNEQEAFADTIEDLVASTGIPDDELFRCGIPGCSVKLEFGNFTPHLVEHMKVLRRKKVGGVFNIVCFQCPHCRNSYHRATDLRGHLQLSHARHRFFCYVCCDTAVNIKLLCKHFVRIHWNAPEMRSEILCRKIVNNKKEVTYYVANSSALSPAEVQAFGKRLKLEWQRKKVAHRTHFKPSDVDLLPPQPIFQNELFCADCLYKTKVRSNMTRHLQGHKTLTIQMANVVDPVNPVPCLSSTERHFDRMTNLASSSLVTTNTNANVGAVAALPVTKTTPSNIFHQYVEDTKRFTCGVPNCGHIASDDKNFCEHLKSEHNNVISYSCPFCNSELCKRLIVCDRITSHLKYHGKVVYECEECHQQHYQKGLIERHINEKHSTMQLNVIKHTREIPGDFEGTITKTLITGKHFNDPAAIASVITKAKSPPTSSTVLVHTKYIWECDYCQHLTDRLDQIAAHCAAQHKANTRYKCGHCSFNGAMPNQIVSHHNFKHPEKPYTLANNYHRREREKPFGPLWQRDDPNRTRRHIRGIQIENEEESASHQESMHADEGSSANVVDGGDGLTTMDEAKPLPMLGKLVRSRNGCTTETKSDETNAQKVKHDGEGNANGRVNTIQHRRHSVAGISPQRNLQKACVKKSKQSQTKSASSPTFFYTCPKCDYATADLLLLVQDHWMVHHVRQSLPSNTDNSEKDASDNIFTFGLQHRFKCAVCLSFDGFPKELKEHVRKTHLVELSPPADPISVLHNALVCGFCEYVGQFEGLKAHYVAAQHWDTDLKEFTADRLEVVLKMNLQQYAYYYCSSCARVFNDLSAHTCKRLTNTCNTYGFLRTGEVLYMCSQCQHVSRDAKQAMHHLIDHYGRFQWCHFCRIDQVSFKSYMQHAYEEHRDEIKDFSTIYPIDDIIRHLENLFVLFPNGLKLSLRNLAQTKYQHLETMQEVYEEICKTSREPPIPTLIISRFIVPHKPNNSFTIAAVPNLGSPIRKRRKTISFNEDIYGDTTKRRKVSELSSPLRLPPPMPLPQLPQPDPPVNNVLNESNSNMKVNAQKLNENTSKQNESNIDTSTGLIPNKISKKWQPRVVLKKLDMSEYTALELGEDKDCVETQRQKACPASRKKPI